MNNLVILGAGQQGKVCKNLAEKIGYKVIAFVDDFQKGFIGDVPVYNSIESIDDFKAKKFFLAFGESKPRLKYYKLIKKLNLETVNLIDEDSKIEHGAVIGTGNYISKDAIIFSSAKIGDCNIINCKAVVATDVRIGNNNNISLGVNLCGGARVGDNCYIGCQSSISSGFHIGNNVTVGAGAIVLDDVEDNKFVCGIPAKEKERKYRYDTSKSST